MTVLREARTVVERGIYPNGKARKTAPKTASDGPGIWRCWNCSKFLLRVQVFQGEIEISCQRCRRTNVIAGEGLAETHGLAQPVMEEIVLLMESRWNTALNNKALRRAELSSGLRFKVFVRDAFKCRYCGRSAAQGALLHVDHVMPRSKGGSDLVDNLVTACLDCNLGKSNQLLNEAPP